MKRYPHVPGECATPNSNHFPDGTRTSDRLFTVLMVLSGIGSTVLIAVAVFSF